MYVLRAGTAGAKKAGMAKACRRDTFGKSASIITTIIAVTSVAGVKSANASVITITTTIDTNRRKSAEGTGTLVCFRAFLSLTNIGKLSS